MTYFAPSPLTDEPSPFWEPNAMDVQRVYFITGVMGIENANYVNPVFQVYHAYELHHYIIGVTKEEKEGDNTFDGIVLERMSQSFVTISSTAKVISRPSFANRPGFGPTWKFVDLEIEQYVGKKLAFSLRTYYNSEQQNLRKITQILETQTGKIVDVSLAYIFPGIEDVEQFPKGIAILKAINISPFSNLTQAQTSRNPISPAISRTGDASTIGNRSVVPKQKFNFGTPSSSSSFLQSEANTTTFTLQHNTQSSPSQTNEIVRSKTPSFTILSDSSVVSPLFPRMQKAAKVAAEKANKETFDIDSTSKANENNIESDSEDNSIQQEESPAKRARIPSNKARESNNKRSPLKNSRRQTKQ